LGYLHSYYSDTDDNMGYNRFYQMIVDHNMNMNQLESKKIYNKVLKDGGMGIP